jgi:hypothetical protein
VHADSPPSSGAPGGRRFGLKLFVVVALAFAVGLATAVSPFASASPDGLDRVAEEKGFVEQGRLAGVQENSPIPDYAFPGVEDERLATGLAGFAGTLGVFAVGYGVAALMRRRGAGPGKPAGQTAPAG